MPRDGPTRRSRSRGSASGETGRPPRSTVWNCSRSPSWSAPARHLRCWIWRAGPLGAGPVGAPRSAAPDRRRVSSRESHRVRCARPRRRRPRPARTDSGRPPSTGRCRRCASRPPATGDRCWRRPCAGATCCLWCRRSPRRSASPDGCGAGASPPPYCPRIGRGPPQAGRWWAPAPPCSARCRASEPSSSSTSTTRPWWPRIRRPGALVRSPWSEPAAPVCRACWSRRSPPWRRRNWRRETC